MKRLDRVFGWFGRFSLQIGCLHFLDLSCIGCIWLHGAAAASREAMRTGDDRQLRISERGMGPFDLDAERPSAT